MHAATGDDGGLNAEVAVGEEDEEEADDGDGGPGEGGVSGFDASSFTSCSGLGELDAVLDDDKTNRGSEGAYEGGDGPVEIGEDGGEPFEALEEAHVANGSKCSS